MTLEEQADKLSIDEIASVLAQNNSLQTELSEVKQQLAWFKSQLFGQKSEKRKYVEDRRQLFLGEFGKLESEAEPEQTKKVSSYQRGKAKKKPLEDGVSDSGLRFSSDVPVEVIEVENPELEGLSEDDYDVISEKVSHKLAQKPGAYVVLRYLRKTVKLKDSKELITPAAPPAVLERSFADVSFLVGMLIDKFLYHLPLYRQHQRLKDSGIVVSRATLTNLAHRTSELLIPIYLAQFDSILASDTLCMDEIPIKASRKIKGRMSTSYFWPIFGDKHEICFPWRESRAHSHVPELLSGFSGGVLLTDGYAAYESYSAAQQSIIHAECWSHSRRKFIKAIEAEPSLAGKALDFIAEFYKFEKIIKEQKLEADKKLAYRVMHTKPVVEQFFDWLEQVLAEHALMPSNPFTQAANYAFKREEQLKVFLRFPELQIDTNHEERELRAIAVGRKNWNFCWTEVGAEYVGVIQSLIRTCILQKVNPYHYLVDVLQRMDSHPQNKVELLTPRLWKESFRHKRIKAPIDIAREGEHFDSS